MLGNWDAAAASGAVVDAQYDLGTLTEDIIGCIAFGSELAKLCGRTPTTFTDGNKVWSFTLKKKKSK